MGFAFFFEDGLGEEWTSCALVDSLQEAESLENRLEQVLSRAVRLFSAPRNSIISRRHNRFPHASTRTSSFGFFRAG